MNIGENKKVLALSAVFALAFGGVMYLGYQSSSDAAAINGELEDIQSSFEDFNNADFAPTADSEKILKAASQKVSKLADSLNGQLEAYSKAAGVSKSMSSVEFQNAVRKSILELGERAKKEGVTLGVPAATLGMATYQNNVAVKDEVPYRAFLLRAVDRAANILVDAKAPSIDKVFCADLPADASADLKDAPEYFPLNFEISFNAQRGTLPKVFNALLEDKDFFYTITGISAASSAQPTNLDKYIPPPEEIEAAGMEESVTYGADGQIMASPTKTRVVATRKLGNQAELVHVHMTLQVLFFNPEANTK